MRILHVLSTPPASGAVQRPLDPMHHAPGSQAAANAEASADSKGTSSCGLGPHPQKSDGQPSRRQRGGRGHEGAFAGIKLIGVQARRQRGGDGLSLLFLLVLNWFSFLLFLLVLCEGQHRQRLEDDEIDGEVVARVAQAFYACGGNVTPSASLRTCNDAHFGISPRDGNVTL